MKKFPVENVYKKCIQSDLELEYLIMKKTGLYKYFSFVIPKSVKLKNVIKNRVLWTMFFYIISQLWWILLFPALELYNLIKFLILKIGVRTNQKSLDGNIILGLSPRIYDLEKRILIDVDFRIDFPWVNKLEMVNDEKSVDFLSLITYKDILIAFMMSLTKAKSSIKDSYDRTAKLLTYSAFEWFLVYNVLERELKTCKKLYFCNQYDRWIHLIDNIDIDGKRVLIQHGVVVPFELKDIRNISEIYCFNKKQKEIFKNSIFVSCKDINFNNIPLSINLSDKLNDRNGVLIIGQPFSIDIEINIVKDLLNRNKDKDMDIYIKPHPRFGSSMYNCVKDKVNLINDIKFYPKVDLALAYESTLGLEYEASGVKVIWIKNKRINDVIKEVEAFFEENDNKKEVS